VTLAGSGGRVTDRATSGGEGSDLLAQPVKSNSVSPSASFGSGQFLGMVIFNPSELLGVSALALGKLALVLKHFGDTSGALLRSLVFGIG